MPPRPDRPVALITGAARRVGAVIARTLHAAGYDLALHFRHSSSEAHALAAELESQRPHSTLLLQAELEDTTALAPLINKLIAHFGRLDGVVNNAALFFSTSVDTTTVQQWDALFAVNSRAPFFLAQAAAPHLQAAHGAIVNLLDIYAEAPRVDLVAYSCSKAALATVTRALALALAPSVRVNAVAPGAILWPETPAAEQLQTAILRSTPLDRTGTPQEVADAVLWLLRDATYCTGELLHVDGGRTLS